MLTALVGIALVVAMTALAGAIDRPKFRFNAADQRAARAAVLRLADLRPAGGWKGGLQKPDINGLTCPNYNPKQSDLVVTGAAEAVFSRQGSLGGQYAGRAVVLGTARMVRLDWQRSTVNAPGLLSCLRSDLAKSLGIQGTIISFKRIAFPVVAPCSGAFRGIFEVRAGGQVVRWMIEIVALCRERTELTVQAASLASEQRFTSAQVVRLARTLLGRVRA